jgi:hypothetical protein
MKNGIKLILLVCMVLAATPVFSQYYDDYDDDYDGGGGAETSWFDLSSVAHPWYFGISGGYTQNTLYQGGAEKYRVNEKWEGAGGVTIALTARYQIFNWLAVQAEPTYITKNYQWTGGLTGALPNSGEIRRH